MKEIWGKIQMIISSIDDKSGKSFNKPAKDLEINLLKTYFDKNIPNEFMDYLKVYNGQSHNNFEIQPFSYYAFIPINEIIELITMQRNIWEDEGKFDAINENKIQSKIWDKNWIPIASESTNYLILDLNPGKNGVYGQVFKRVIGKDYDDDEVVIANSFLEFSNLLLIKLQNKDYIMEQDAPIVFFNDYWI